MDNVKITVNDCLALPIFENVQIKAGKMGLNNEVKSVTVMEATDLTNVKYLKQYSKDNELVITSLYAIYDDIEKQCELIRQLHQYSSSGIMIFMMKERELEISKEFLKLADELKFPVISVPTSAGITFSDAIHAIANLIFQYQVHKIASLPNLLLEYHLHSRDNIDIRQLLAFVAEKYHYILFVLDRNAQIIQEVADRQLPVEEVEKELGASIGLWCIEECKKRAAYVFARPRYWELEYCGMEIHSIPIRDVVGETYVIFFITEKYAEYFQMQQVSSLLQFYISQFSTVNSVKNQNVFNNALVSSIINCNVEYTNYLCSQLGKKLGAMCTAFVIDEGNLEKTERMLDLDFILQCYHSIEEQIELSLVGKFEGMWILLMGECENEAGESKIQDIFYEEIKVKHKNICIYMRTRLQGINEIADFYKMVRDNINLAPIIFPHCHTFGFPQLRFLTYCNSLKEKLWDNSTHEFFPMLGLLMKENGLLEVLECVFLDANMNIQVCADLLFIHKNTVYYRLKKIQKYLGYDPFEMPVSVDLMLELALHRLLVQGKN